MYLRPLLFLAFACLLLLPDWSTARPFRRWVNSAPLFRPVANRYSVPVTYSHPAPVSYGYPAAPVASSQPAPVVYSAPVYSPPCPPMFLTPMVACPPVTPAPRGPTVVPERMADTKPPVTAAPPAVPKAAPSVIRQAGNEERLPPMPVPIPVPPRPVVDPQPAPPKMSVELAPPKAIIEESDKPDSLPAFSLPAKEKESPTDLPKFDLPPLPPLAPPTTAKSSPLNADAVADVYPVAGPAPADRAATRSVSFVNKSSRDVILTVAGKMTTLPSGQYLQVTLPATFAWQIGGEKERHVTVPDTAPGVDVVLRR
jgi:hypothetical protein